MDALVTDAGSRGTLSGIRALGRAGLRVVALASAPLAAGLWSRFAAARELGPDPARDPVGFAERIAAVATEKGPLVVYPGSEVAIDALLDAPTELPRHAHLPYADAEAVNLLRDKRRLMDLAAEASLRVPCELAEGTVAEFLVAPPSLPCVIKSARPGVALPSGRAVTSRHELRELLQRLPPQERLLAQERLQGALMSVAIVVARDGGVVARLQSLASRTWPPDGGPSAFAMSVAPDEELIDRCARLLHRAGYWGLAQLQFVADGGEPALIDFNPRFYGSMPLAIACGVNLPAAWHAVALDQARPSPGPYLIGVTYRWLEADLTAARHGNVKLALRRAPAPRAGAMWAADDPLPALLLSGDVLGARIRQRLARRG